MDEHTRHESEKSDEEQFEDALEEKIKSPLPVTRVERVDSKPAHGEVPGTAAHDMRKQDAMPDELGVVPDKSESRGAPSSPIPKTIVEKIDPESQSHGEVPGTEAFEMRQADARPDEITKAPAASSSGPPPSGATSDEQPDAEATLDDFDDFNEGDEDDDFGAFDEGDDAEDISNIHDEPQPPAHSQLTPTDTDTSHLPSILDFEQLDNPEDMAAAVTPYLRHIYPTTSQVDDEKLGPPRSSFLNERSQSLWAQLVAPPPLQPPNWTKSRTRRLFLVSLGVPVDLDEILPASKQKKLVLPSVDLEQDGDKGAANGSVTRLKQKNASSTSVNSSSSRPERRRKGQPVAPEFDDNTARLLCSTTKEALSQFSVEELQVHNKRLEELQKTAHASLEYWLLQRDSASGDKEAFEEVINNFVKHAKKIRT